MRHGDYPIANLQARGRCRIDNHANGLVTEFMPGLTSAPGLPLGAHGRDEYLNLDDIARRLRIRSFGNLGLAHTGNFYA